MKNGGRAGVEPSGALSSNGNEQNNNFFSVNVNMNLNLNVCVGKK